MTKIWLITGAAGGLGRHLVRTALGAGCRVLATDLREDALADLGAAADDDRLRTMPSDVTDPVAAREAVRYAVDAFGGLDVVVNNAGRRDVGSIEDMPEDDFRRTVETNLFGAVNMVRAALPVMRPRRSGHLVQVSTIGGRRAQPGLGAYQTAAWALGGFSEILSREVAPLGIHATVVEPGGIRTPFADEPIPTGGWHEDYEPTVGRFARTYQRNPDVQRGDPAGIARAVLRLTGEPHPPARLLLGSDAVWLAPRIAEARAAEDAAWRDVSLSTDREGLPDFADTEVAALVRPPSPAPGPRSGP
ncbi:short-chain dehydrogenase/reductase [Streptomyces sulfonofaciens]|uniref:Short-chain dehydrogenase/reductase n=1 Tax=Streptomyces sulfonofaciens TaxID=68272 RepID=A0A919GFS9_9ACTN|nr:SDR family NAD(P)-dependent oxidoreductase [Streptomyces sulfonofaciens]GHH83614.1 short-chain dehydrogenase/reductase [Streptomyces sulfonofaciens]